jgi:hypothetical protein
MSVASTAKRLAHACRKAMPDAHVDIEHSRAPWGRSSYVYVMFKGHVFKARVSDHGIGERRYREDWCSLYLADGARPEAWSYWMFERIHDYALLGGSFPPSDNPLFTPQARSTDEGKPPAQAEGAAQ